ncbi:CsbD family protein [Pseudomonas akapageensis]|uniref:CsbD family protein n=1 Tax=Pseudomonas akapageensis TaxID=2609961 RepID=UPI00140761F3|nr:CsbD family protein [Pseudomonas akapageensis]
MNKDQIKGRVKEIGGNIKEATGKAVGNERLEEKGRVEKTIGKVQAGLGDLKEDLKD